MQCRFGDFAVVAIGRQEYEIVHLAGSETAIARFTIDETELPKLRLEAMAPERRNLGSMDDAAEPVVLDTRRGNFETNFELVVKRIENGIEISLSGDHRLHAGARYFKVFLWRAECKIVDGKPVLHGPYLLRDLDS